MGKKRKKINLQIERVNVRFPSNVILKHGDTLHVEETLKYTPTEDGLYWTGFEINSAEVIKCVKRHQKK